MRKIAKNKTILRFWGFLSHIPKHKKSAFFIILFLLCLGFALNNFASKNNFNNSAFEDITINDTIKKNQPKIDIKVKKEYDDNGNITRYDSSYSSTYYYSNGNLSQEEMDSILNNFKPFFFDNYSNILDHSFDNFFFNDSLFFEDFYREDFFEREFQKEYFPFENIMRQFDSLKNEFYRRSMPYSPDNNLKGKGTQL